MKEEAGSYYQKVNSWVTVGSNDGSGLFTMRLNREGRQGWIQRMVIGTGVNR